MNMADEDLQSLKSSSPDGRFKSREKIYYLGGTTKYGYELPEGSYYFDTYDEEDDTCFIAVKKKHVPKKAHKKMSHFCYWIDYNKIKEHMHTFLTRMLDEVIRMNKADEYDNALYHLCCGLGKQADHMAFLDNWFNDPQEMDDKTVDCENVHIESLTDTQLTLIAFDDSYIGYKLTFEVVDGKLSIVNSEEFDDGDFEDEISVNLILRYGE